MSQVHLLTENIRTIFYVMESKKMKYILLLFLSLNVFSQETVMIEPELTPEEIRINLIKEQIATIGIVGNTYDSQEVIAKLLSKCNVTGENSAFYYDKLFDENNTENLNCFLIKKSEVDADDLVKIAKKEARKNKQQELDGYDCTKVKDDYAKLLCEERE